MVDGETYVDPDDGLVIPPEHRGMDRPISVRTPSCTVQINADGDAFKTLPVIVDRHFQSTDEFDDGAYNPELCPDLVQLKGWGGSRITLRVVDMRPSKQRRVRRRR